MLREISVLIKQSNIWPSNIPTKLIIYQNTSRQLQQSKSFPVKIQNASLRIYKKQFQQFRSFFNKLDKYPN